MVAVNGASWTVFLIQMNRPTPITSKSEPSTTPKANSKQGTLISSEALQPRKTRGTVISSITTANQSETSREIPAQKEASHELPQIYVYAEVLTSQSDTSSSGQYARKPHLLTTEQNNKLLSSEGLTLSAPGGKPYQFHYDHGNPTAKIGPQPDNTDPDTLALTIINMIDNVLAKGSAVNVDTDNPTIADIAHHYFQHLKTQGIGTQKFTIISKGVPYINHSLTINPSLLTVMDHIDKAENKLQTKYPLWKTEVHKTPDDKAVAYRAILSALKPQETPAQVIINNPKP